ncbi:hypothetical protein ACFL27_10600 [candidate division CSSED10-310 bacterium]|uniref:Uncharacterized protein n=1 Tax=candidate division CSSED10-310 bacterium TaxID=2855610 RepID=A0ABV6YWN8_UNCC1
MFACHLVVVSIPINVFPQFMQKGYELYYLEFVFVLQIEKMPIVSHDVRAIPIYSTE